MPPMTRSSAAAPPAATTDRAHSPANSNMSSDSEGRPVREKFKETRIDNHAFSDPAGAAEHDMKDAPNGDGDGEGAGAGAGGERSRSPSEAGRGRLRRKRSHEDFEEAGSAKAERHVRKKSRDVTSPQPGDVKGSETCVKSSVETIDEHERDEPMDGSATLEKPGKGASTPTDGTSDKEGGKGAAKRTREQVEHGDSTAASQAADASQGTGADAKIEEPLSKRPREKSELGGFGNTSGSSPFASLSSKPTSAETQEKPAEQLVQTSDDKFKSSGFGAFAASTSSPFGAIGKSTSSSPFASAPSTGPGRLSSFASPQKSASPAPSGFGGLGASTTQSAFGGGASTFGNSLSQSGFGGLGAPRGGLSSFATPGATDIKGLSTKPARPFGAAAEPEKEGSDDEDGSEDGSDNEDGENEKEKSKSKQAEQTARANLAPQEVETGEEHEDTIWAGRAKLYVNREKAWHERGVGNIKLNITKATDGESRKARFILRADGTHRLLLNAAVTKSFKFGGPDGERTNDGKLLFSTPTADGKLELHLLKMRPEKGMELYDEVQSVKEQAL